MHVVVRGGIASAGRQSQATKATLPALIFSSASVSAFGAGIPIVFQSSAGTAPNVWSADPVSPEPSAFGLLLAVLGIVVGAILMTVGVWRSNRAGSRCDEPCPCGYSRAGLGERACPECGREHAWPGGAEL